MTQREVIELISDSIIRLREYNTKVKLRINDLSYRENDIQQGRQLLSRIQRGELFEDENGRNTEYELLVGDEEFKELRNELSKTANLVRLLKGDISLEVYKQKDNEINSNLIG